MIVYPDKVGGLLVFIGGPQGSLEGHVDLSSPPIRDSGALTNFSSVAIANLKPTANLINKENTNYTATITKNHVAGEKTDIVKWKIVI